MAKDDRDPSIVALEFVYTALKLLDPKERQKILNSVHTLLEIEGPSAPEKSLPSEPARAATPFAQRPISLVELVNEKKPSTNSQRMALFAYYREKREAVSRFSRNDLKSYFAKAKLAPASNFDRDFVEAVKKGWIHEDGAESYLTTKGIEAIESSFAGETKRTSSKPSKAKSKGARKR